jgi:hypothetical protein
VVSQLCYIAPHGNKETKLSHLNSQESGVSVDFASREKGCVKSIQVSAKIEGIQEQGATCLAQEKR